MIFYLASIIAALATTMSLQAREINLAFGKVEGEKVWYNCKLLDLEGRGWSNVESYYDRLPKTANGLVRPPVWNLGHNSSGMLYRFKINSKTLSVRWKLNSKILALPHMSATGVSGVDVYGKKDGKWQYIRSIIRPRGIDNKANMHIGYYNKFKLYHYNEFMLYLPLYNGIEKIEIGLDKGAKLKTLDKKRKQVVFYGTSITQGGCTSRPGMAFTAITGRKLGVEIINLGFSGNGKMEPEVSDLLCELNSDCFVLDCLWNMTPDMAKTRYEPFVRKLAAKHPKTPILIVEDCHVKDISPTPKGRVAYDVYKRLKAEGVGNLYYLSNKGMLGDDFEATVDGTHPNDLGMMRMANVFAPAIAKILDIKLKK